MRANHARMHRRDGDPPYANCMDAMQTVAADLATPEIKPL
jgi:hypothetical protein